jgi:serine/threonine-protein kinase
MTSLPCPPEHWSRFSDLLDSAMDLPEPDRAIWLQKLDGNDAVLRPWLARVLGSAASISTSDFLSSTRLPGQGDAGFAAGELIGPYRLDQLLGEGGMGQVWRARRADDGPQREVALKLPHTELLAGPFRQRFRRERDMVAALTHPHIGALYDAGVSAEGHPYLALELIEGEPITAYCRATAATLERRVELIRQVLDALGYAHSRLIVHRDIKPSNVMVTAGGQVKLLDFGIAKLLDGTPSGDAPLTQPAGRLATPGYAPPEQMDGGVVTVAADLFAVGVLLFELCTGQRPPLLRGPDSEAPLASSRANAAFGNSPEFAGMARRLRGDLDAIIAKALAFDPAQRYASADSFGRDLRRWGDGLPVSARRIGWGTMAVKFIKRNKIGVGLAAVLALTLVGGTAAVAWQARRAEREAVRANAIKDFALGLFNQSDPRTGKPSISMTAKQLLDIGADRADAAFAHDPATEIDLLETLGSIYDAMSDGTRAETVWGRRVALMRKLYGITDPRTVAGAMQLVNSEVEFQDEGKARTLLDEIRGPVLSQYGPESLQRAQWLFAHSQALRDASGARAEAIAETTEAIEILETHFPNESAYADAVLNLSDYQYDAEQYAASLATLEKMRNILVAHHEFDAMEELMYHASKGTNFGELGRLKEADEQIALEQLQAERQLGKQSLWYIHAVTGRAIFASVAGDRQRADTLFRSLVSQGLMSEDMTKAATGLPNSARRAYGAALARDGLAAEAIPFLEAALAATKLHKHDEANLRRTEQQLGDAYDQVGRTAEARVLLQAARDEFLRYGNPGGVLTLNAEERWGWFLLDHGEPAAAAQEFHAILDQAHGKQCAAAAMASAGIARIALAAGDLAEADKRSAAAIFLLAATTTNYDVRFRVDTSLVRAQVLAAMGRGDQARDLATQAVANAKLWYAPGVPQIIHAEAVLARVKDTMKTAK